MMRYFLISVTLFLGFASASTDSISNTDGLTCPDITFYCLIIGKDLCPSTGCPQGQICCSVGCDSDCWPQILPDYRCPVIDTTNIRCADPAKSTAKCHEQKPCATGFMCCSGACGGSGCLPIPETNDPRCPAYAEAPKSSHKLVYECNSTNPCTGREICCKTQSGSECLDLEDPKCPAVNRNQVCAVKAEEECKCNEDCPSNTETSCCSTECGGTKCLSTADARCNYYDIGVQCARDNDVTCNATNACGDDKICCPYECFGKKCQAAQDPRCPAFDDKITCIRQNDVDCDVNTPCGKNEICCGYECGGRKCVSLSAPQCPKISPGIDCPVRPKCDPNDEMACTAGSRCCPDACGIYNCWAPGTTATSEEL